MKNLFNFHSFWKRAPGKHALMNKNEYRKLWKISLLDIKTSLTERPLLDCSFSNKWLLTCQRLSTTRRLIFNYLSIAVLISTCLMPQKSLYDNSLKMQKLIWMNWLFQIYFLPLFYSSVIFMLFVFIDWFIFVWYIVIWRPSRLNNFWKWI